MELQKAGRSIDVSLLNKRERIREEKKRKMLSLGTFLCETDFFFFLQLLGCVFGPELKLSGRR